MTKFNICQTIPVFMTLCLFSLNLYADTAPVITISDTIPYAEGIKVPDDIRNDCKLNTVMVGYLNEYLMESGYIVNIAGKDTPRHDGVVLEVQIIGVSAQPGTDWSRGGGSTLTIRANLIENAMTIDSYANYRKSNRRFSDECGMLINGAKTLSKDITRWLLKTQKNRTSITKSPAN